MKITPTDMIFIFAGTVSFLGLLLIVYRVILKMGGM